MNVGAGQVGATPPDPVAKSIITTQLSRNYHDVLPSVNTVFEPADNFLIRASAAYVMARPDLPSLLPGGATATVSGSTFNVTENNPNLNPYRAKTADMSFEWYYDSFTATFDGIDLTNQRTFQYADSIGQRLYYNHYTGRNFFVGLRYSY